MICYLDTSAIVKLLVVEAGSEELWTLLQAAQCTTSRISYAEARAALARRQREQPTPAALWLEARNQLDQDWPSYQVVELTQPLVERAGEFAEAFALRSFDAVQLASADIVRTTIQSDLHFVSYDRILNRAAKLLGMRLPATVPL